ncbi:MAG TPA: glucose-6-phosphate dehydrogenase [Dehalococcoidia bacterium]|nr:glucose-6-phosphate dehydrogenase [Dehalococcoidia bacterium]
MIESQDIVIVGATGNLARRRLLPALYDLEAQGHLPKRGRIVGAARRPMSAEAFRGMVAEAVKGARLPWDEKVWASFSRRLDYVPFTGEDLSGLREHLSEASRLVYLATPPAAFGPIVRDLASHGLTEGSRVVIEKPFGRDIVSARALDAELREVFDESQIFRIDHFLGKETVQNILVFRFGNSVFERVWNRDAIDHIELTVAETVGVEGRGDFYEGVGALRDVVQNHMLQILSLLTMEPPASFHAENIRDEKLKLLRAVRPVSPGEVVRGQYTRGRIEGREVPGYRDEENVAPDSETETFVALRLWIDNWRWAGVPIYLRTGKRLPRTATEIEIAFRDVPTSYFAGTFVHQLQPNQLTLCIQPSESIQFSFLAKKPGPEIEVEPVTMRFDYEAAFSVEPAEAYERLLLEAMEGDHTLFVRGDSVEQAWSVLQPVLDAPPPLRFYPAGTWGPAESQALVAPKTWHLT